MDAEDRPINVYYLLPFFSFSFFLTFFPSLFYGYKHENTFPALEALQGGQGVTREQ